MSGVLCVGLTTLDGVHHVDGPPRWGAKRRPVGGDLVAALAAGLPALPDAAALAAGVAAIRCAHLGARAWLADPALDRFVEVLLGGRR